MNNKFKLHNTLIHIGNNSFFYLDEFVHKNEPTKVFIFVDQNTKKYCLPILMEHTTSLKGSIIIEVDKFDNFKNSELLKSMNVVTEISKYLLTNNIDKNSLIINLGGGVICDLGGFISSIIKRGVKFINVPTTLMSQIDASVGGKVAVNLNHYKNQIGLFSDPALIVIYPPYNRSLDDVEFNFSLSEVLKYGLIYDKLFWNNINIDESGSMFFKHKIITNKSNLLELISECIKMKIQIVQSDYYDEDNRRKLNFGHSISHAIESCFLEKSISSIHHGSALALGMICETYLSYKKFKFSKSNLNAIVKKISRLFPVIKYKELGFEDSFDQYLKLDKKNINSIYQFTLIKDIGDSVVNVSVIDSDVLESLNFYDQIYRDG